MRKAIQPCSRQVLVQPPPLQAALPLNLLPAATLGSSAAAAPSRLQLSPQLRRSHSARTALNVLPLVTAASSEDGATDIISLNHWTAAVCVTARI